MSDYPFNEEELLRRVEKAAKHGASSGNRSSNFIQTMLAVLVVAVLFIAADKLLPSNKHLDTGKVAEEHDLVLEDHGFLGYTVADFAEAVLGDVKQLKKIEVYSAEISDVATLTNAGFAKLKIFSKCQLLTYHGTATYTVDLSKLSEKNFELDEENKVITVYIPHTVQEKINIPEDEIEFGDTEKGLLAFGSVTMTAEQSSAIQKEARSKMEQKLLDENTLETADRFAKMSVWELYQPLVSSVSPEYKLEIEFLE